MDMENLDKLFSEMMAKDDAYLKAEMDLRNICIKMLLALPFDKNGRWYFNEDNEPSIGWGTSDEGCNIKGIIATEGTIFLITEDDGMMMVDEIGVDDLCFVARVARNEMARRN